MNKFFRNLDTAPENYGLLRTIYFAFFTRGIMTVMIGSLLPYVRDANALTYSQSGMLLSAHQCGNLLAVLVAGFLPYAVGRKKSTLIMDSGTAIGFALAASPSPASGAGP